MDLKQLSNRDGNGYLCSMVKSFDEEIDLQGLLCPLPVLKAGKKLRSMQSGQILKVLSSDPMAAIDIPHYCQEQSHELLSSESEGDVFMFRIRRGDLTSESV